MSAAGPVDWDALRRRVAAAGEALGAGPPTPERAARVLAERARELARPPAPPPAADALEVIAFTLSGERYGVETRHVIEVFRLESLTRLPGAEPQVVGLTAWRGELLAVHDLRRMTGGAATALSEQSRVVILGADAPVFGVLADAVEGLVRVAAPPRLGAAPGRAHLRGVTGDGMLILDAEMLIRTCTQGEGP